MDGLLIDTVPIYVDAFVQASHDIGQPLTADYVRSLTGLLSAELQQRLVADQGAGFDLRAFLCRASARLARPLAGRVPLRPGALHLIQAASAGGLPMAVATSMPSGDAVKHLQVHDLRERFIHVVGRDDVAQGKPHPDVYREATARLGLAPADCMALEDSVNGVRAAATAGLQTIMVPDVVLPTEDIATLCVGIATDLYEVAGWLGLPPGTG